MSCDKVICFIHHDSCSFPMVWPCGTANNSDTKHIGPPNNHTALWAVKIGGTKSIFYRLAMTVNGWMVANSLLPLDWSQLSLKLCAASHWTRLIIGVWIQSIWTSHLATVSLLRDIVTPLSLWITHMVQPDFWFENSFLRLYSCSNLSFLGCGWFSCSCSVCLLWLQYKAFRHCHLWISDKQWL